jgi:hypothetical protein
MINNNRKNPQLEHNFGKNSRWHLNEKGLGHGIRAFGRPSSNTQANTQHTKKKDQYTNPKKCCKRIVLEIFYATILGITNLARKSENRRGRRF